MPSFLADDKSMLSPHYYLKQNLLTIPLSSRIGLVVRLLFIFWRFNFVYDCSHVPETVKQRVVEAAKVYIDSPFINLSSLINRRFHAMLGKPQSFRRNNLQSNLAFESIFLFPPTTSVVFIRTTRILR